jgi:hypothetical protein
MSYDIHCYRSRIGKPDISEAQETMDAEDIYDDDGQKVKHDIAKALTDFNPRLEAFKFDYNEIAKLQNLSVDEAKRQYNHIELNPPDGDLAIQVTVFNNSVSLTIPYWYKGNDARQVFQQLMDYLKVIRKTSGYFVYDPQTAQVFDPLTTEIDGVELYINTTEKAENLQTKPWWKFW